MGKRRMIIEDVTYQNKSKWSIERDGKRIFGNLQLTRPRDI